MVELAKATAVQQRLEASQAAARERTAARKAESAAVAANGESPAQFLAALAADSEALTREIAAASTSSALDALAERAAAVEERVARAAYFLPSYDVRAAQAQVVELKQAVEQQRAKAAPRKRFAFKKRPKAAASNAASAAEGGAGAPGGDAAQQQPEQQQHEQAQHEAPADFEVAVGRGECGGEAGRDVVIDSDGGDYTFAQLKGCRIVVRGACTALRLFQLEDCQVFAAPVAGPCFVDGATGCTLHVAARQIRVHRATETAFHLRMLSRPVIEECRALRFAPLGEGEAEAAYDGAADALKEAGMGEPTELWREVDDFLWIKTDAPSPHWAVMPAAERRAAAECALRAIASS